MSRLCSFFFLAPSTLSYAQVLSINVCFCVFVGGSSTRRRQAREQNGKRAEHNEGFSSDDEETSTDITSFDIERGVVIGNPQH